MTIRHLISNHSPSHSFDYRPLFYLHFHYFKHFLCKKLHQDTFFENKHLDDFFGDTTAVLK